MVLKEALSAISITLIVFCTKLLAKFDSSNLLSYMYFFPNYSLTIAACVVQCKEIFQSPCENLTFAKEEALSTAYYDYIKR